MFRFCAGTFVVGIVFGTTLLNAAAPENLRQSFETLLPGMGAEKIAESQSAQQQWENICLNLCKPGKEPGRIEASRLMAENLGPDTPSGARIWLLRQLEYLGGRESVVAIAAAMDDEDLLVGRAARRALTNNPSAEASQQLVAKLARAEDPVFKIGLLNALAYRADPSTVAAAAKPLNDTNLAVVAAAARALGEIGTPEAAANLKKARENSPPQLREVLGNASLRCAATMVARGQRHAAQAMYGELQHRGEPESVRLGALDGLFTVADEHPVAKICAILRGSDRGAAGVAAAQIAKLNATEVKELAGNLAYLPPASQVLALEALRVRADKRVLPDVVAIARSKDPKVRIAALRALSSVGDASVVPLLLEALSDGGPTARAARGSLEALYGEHVDAAIIAAMQTSENIQRRALLIEILKRRRSVAAVPVLLEESRHSEPHVRTYAMAALSQLAQHDDVPEMVQGVLVADAGSERDGAEKAVMLLCNRVTDRDERADPILQVFDTLADEDQKSLLPLLGRIGGKRSLEKIQTALESKDPDLYGVGVRAMCNWPDGDVAQELLDIFQSSQEETYRLQAMRAFIRVIALRHERPNSESLEMLREAMKFCSRDEERNLILSRTTSAEIRSLEALQFVLPYLKNPATAQQACRAVVGLAHHRYLRRPNQAEFNKALNEVIAVSDDPALVDQARRYRSDL